MAERTDVLFVHGAGEGAHQEDLKIAEVLQKGLGASFNVLHPRLPGQSDPRYRPWRDRIAERLAGRPGVMLAGHSLGAAVILKYLAEESSVAPVAGVFLLAAPFWGAPGWESAEFGLPPDAAKRMPSALPVFLYHSEDDEVVPLAHLQRYVKLLPHATARHFKSGGHQLTGQLATVVGDIRSVAGQTPNA